MLRNDVKKSLYAPTFSIFLFALIGCQSMPLPLGSTDIGSSLYRNPQTLREVVDGLKEKVRQDMTKAEVFEALQLTPKTKNLAELDRRVLQELLFRIEERASSDEIEQAIIHRLRYSGYRLPLLGVKQSWWLHSILVKWTTLQKGFDLTLYIFFKDEILFDIGLTGPPNIDRKDTSYLWSFLGKLAGNTAGEVVKQGAKGIAD